MIDEQKKAGRPTLPDSERKKNRGFCCNDDAWEAIKELANKHGISKNEFLEHKALGRIK